MLSRAELDALMNRAKEAIARKDLDRVLEATGEVLKHEPKRVGAYLLRAEALRKRNPASGEALICLAPTPSNLPSSGSVM